MDFLFKDLRIECMMFCLVIYLIAKTFRRRHESPKHSAYHRLLWVGLMQVILVSAILLGDVYDTLPPVVDFIVVLAYFFGLCLCTYGWFMYSEVSCDSKLVNNKYIRIVLIVPLVVYFMLCVTSWWTHMLMYIDDHGIYQRGRLSFLQFLIPGIYALVLVYRALARWWVTRRFDAYMRGVLFFPIIHALAIGLQIKYGGDFIVIATVASLAVAYIELYSIEEHRLAAADERSNAIQRQYNIIEALSSEFEDVFLLNFSTKVSTTFKIHGQLVEEDQKHTHNYAEACQYYISRYVHIDDRERVFEAFRIENVQQHLLQNPVYTISYRTSDEQAPHYYQVRFTRVKAEKADEELVIFGYQCIDKYMKMRIDLYTDSLTGLRNRHSFDQAQLELQEAPLDQDLVFVSLDVNGLKPINDNLGHMAGDELLCGVANCLNDTLSSLGHIYRTGGDEFIAILHADQQKLQQALLRLDEAIDQWQGEQVGHLSVSHGFASAAQEPQASVKDLIALSDRRMYQAKALYYKHGGHR